MVAAMHVLPAALLPLAVLGFGPSLILVRNNGSSPATALRLDQRQDAAPTTTTGEIKTVNLIKPLGLILEEVQEGAAAGVFVKEISESGSAFAMADELQGMMIAKVMDTECSNMDFDSVMDLIRNTESDEVTLSFAPLGAPTVPTDSYATGTVVTLRVKQGAFKEDLVFDAKVGDNLRLALIANGFEVYQGMQKLGNCGYVNKYGRFLSHSIIDYTSGLGQCGYCAMTFIESDGWIDRSDYEDKKLSKFPGARLSCFNNIQGPATLQKTQR